MTDVHPKHAERHPWIFDTNEYPYVVGLRDDKPIIVHKRYSELSRPARKRFRFAWSKGWKCYFTGATLYGYGVRDYRADQIPWGVSVEHLVPKRHKMFHDSSLWNSIIGATEIVGIKINRRIGHDPLPVKIMTRRHLMTAPINREEPTLDDYSTCFHEIIRSKEMMVSDGGYVWQEASYQDERRKMIARLCFSEMLACEKEFLLLPKDEQNYWIDEFQWKW